MSAAATQRQEIPVVAADPSPADIAAAIIAQLDAALTLVEITRSNLSYLPTDENYRIVDDTVRLWASAHDLKLHEWGQWSTPTHWIEGYSIGRDDNIDRVVTVHTPQSLRVRQPSTEVVVRPEGWSL